MSILSVAARKARYVHTLKNLVDTLLLAIHLCFFTMSVVYAGYTTTSALTLLTATVLLIALGWKNPPISVGDICILYRTGFIPVYTAVFTLITWAYRLQLNPAISYTSLGIVALLATIEAIVVQSLVKRVEITAFVLSSIVGATIAVVCGARALPLSFGLPPLLLLAKRPRLLCDDRPLLYIASIYGASFFVITGRVLSLLSNLY